MITANGDKPHESNGECVAHSRVDCPLCKPSKPAPVKTEPVAPAKTDAHSHK